MTYHREQNDLLSISVIIPCFNAETTIVKCIKSVFSQTYPVFEIIVIDDGSTDRTLLLLNELKYNCPEFIEFRIYEQENSGPSIARNRGINLANGSWIAFLDSDDLWFNNKIEVQVKKISQNETIDFCSVGYGNSKMKKIDSEYISFKELCYSNVFSTPTVMVKSHVIKGIKFNSEQKYGEDVRVWLEIAYKYKCLLIYQILAKNVEEKKVYGDSGLSSNLWKMEEGELSNFSYFYKKKYINYSFWITISSWSILKYLRRFLIVKLK